MEFARRLSHTSEMLQSSTLKDAPPSPPQSREAQPADAATSPPVSPVLGPRPTRSSSAHYEEEPHRRRRSHSECLMLAKTRGGQDLPGPCQEYISSVKQILARNDDQLLHLRRRRSMNLSHPTLFK
ncbi:unnamed protein product [Hyaloperonospora brassicae]|uniref:Uncharacterized protein n=1 Tax=Hyaloperonospora brassicae TaxID=162125 RepID=A0AAV0UGN3_HYABA|nr:unnamed protein product [Hyaloperonospora brassicae]